MNEALQESKWKTLEFPQHEGQIVFLLYVYNTRFSICKLLAHDCVIIFWYSSSQLTVNKGRAEEHMERVEKEVDSKCIVSFATVIRVVTHRSSPLTAAHSSSAFLSSNWPIRSRLPYSGNLVFGEKCNEKYDWGAANKYMRVIGSQ